MIDFAYRSNAHSDLAGVVRSLESDRKERAETQLGLGRPLALAVCLGALVTIGSLLSRADTRSLDIGDTSTRRYLYSGFSGDELAATGRTFAWATERVAKLVIPRTSRSGRSLTLEALPFQVGLERQRIRLILNGDDLGETTLGEGGWQTVRFKLPAGSWKIGANLIELRCSGWSTSGQHRCNFYRYSLSL